MQFCHQGSYRLRARLGRSIFYGVCEPIWSNSQSDGLLKAYAKGERDFRQITAIAVNLFEADLRQINLQ